MVRMRSAVRICPAAPKEEAPRQGCLFFCISDLELPTSVPQARQIRAGWRLQSSGHPAVRICPVAPKTLQSLDFKFFCYLYHNEAERIPKCSNLRKGCVLILWQEKYFSWMVIYQIPSVRCGIYTRPHRRQKACVILHSATTSSIFTAFLNILMHTPDLARVAMCARVKRKPRQLSQPSGLLFCSAM